MEDIQELGAGSGFFIADVFEITGSMNLLTGWDFFLVEDFG